MMNDAKDQARAQYENIVGMVERLEDDPDALERIYEDALSVQVRSDWETSSDKFESAEYEILLCTGGPAVRLIGQLDQEQPRSAKLQFQDWFTPWEVWYEADEKVLLRYASCFYFGE